jgi:hypothetical protein
MMGYAPPPPPVPRWIVERARAPHVALDVSDPATFEGWCSAPAWDTRTLEEFAADGGYPAFPPNLDERGRRVAPTGNTGTR